MAGWPTESCSAAGRAAFGKQGIEHDEQVEVDAIEVPDASARCRSHSLLRRLGAPSASSRGSWLNAHRLLPTAFGAVRLTTSMRLENIASSM